VDTETFTFLDSDQRRIFVYHWHSQGQGQKEPRAIVQISHGMAEHAGRYERVAKALIKEGYEVYANDHRGHGLTAGEAERVGKTGSDGFNKMAEAMAQLTDEIAARHPGVPIYLLGHSMGSFLAQQYMYRYGGKVNGIILSGTNGKHSPLLRLGILIASMLAIWRGDDHRSPLLMLLTLGSYNKAFAPNRTDCDWLSRDETEVDRYIADPFCGDIFTAGFFRDFFRGLMDIHRHSYMERISKQMPVLIIGGERDPVGQMGKGVRQLLDMYSRLGMMEVTCRLYPGGRHEMLNETNREQVTDDVLAWLDRQVDNAQKQAGSAQTGKVQDVDGLDQERVLQEG
jgi:alpha-beta hydrolase superfamily lysophospholipase